MTPERLFAYIEEGFEDRCSTPGCCNRASWVRLTTMDVMVCGVCYQQVLQEMGITEGCCEGCLRRLSLDQLAYGLCVVCRSALLFVWMLAQIERCERG